MGFIDHQQVPVGCCGLMLGQLHRCREKSRTAQYQLFTVKGVEILLLLPQCLIALLIKQGKPQVKAPQHFNQPLMQQGGAVLQSNTRLARGGEQLLVQNHTGFNGFAKADFIGQ